MIAFINDFLEIAELLVKKGADFNDEIRDVNGLNTRDHAEEMGNEHILDMAKAETTIAKPMKAKRLNHLKMTLNKLKKKWINLKKMLKIWKK